MTSDCTSVYAGIVKRHNVCKRHVAIDPGFKQTERTIFSTVINFNGIKIVTAFKYIFEEINSQLENQYLGSVRNFGFTAPQLSDKY